VAIEKLPPNQDGAPRTRISWYIGAKKIVRVLHVPYDEAKKILQQKLAERDLTTWGQVIPKLYPEAAAGFLRDKLDGNCQPGYTDEIERVLVKVLGARWKSEILSEISPTMIREYLRERIKAGSSPQTVKKERTMLGTLWAWAIRQDYAIRSPVDAVEAPKVEKQAPHFLTPAEFRALWLSSPDYLRPALCVLVATGCRAEEFCTLSVQCVKAGKVLFQDRKCRDFVFVDATEGLVKLILAQGHSRSGPAFDRPDPYRPGERVSWSPGTLRRAIQAAAADAKLPDGLTTHWLRHTTATWMICAGIPAWDVKKHLGHASIQTTEGYAHIAVIDWKNEEAYLPAMLRECLSWLPGNKAAPDHNSGAVALPA